MIHQKERLLVLLKRLIDLFFQLFYKNKLEGTHQLGKVKWDWAISRTEINRDQKDVTYLNFTNKKIGDEYFYYTMPDVLGEIHLRECLLDEEAIYIMKKIITGKLLFHTLYTQEF